MTLSSSLREALVYSTPRGVCVRERQRETDRERETDRQRERERDRQRETERDRGAECWGVPPGSSAVVFTRHDRTDVLSNHQQHRSSSLTRFYNTALYPPSQPLTSPFTCSWAALEQKDIWLQSPPPAVLMCSSENLKHSLYRRGVYCTSVHMIYILVLMGSPRIAVIRWGGAHILRMVSRKCVLFWPMSRSAWEAG